MISLRSALEPFTDLRALESLGLACSATLIPEKVAKASGTMAPIPAEVKGVVERLIAENAVMMFSKSYCPFCKKVTNTIGLLLALFLLFFGC